MTCRNPGQISADAEAQKGESTQVQALFQAGQPPGWACPRDKQVGLSARDSSLLVDGMALNVRSGGAPSSWLFGQLWEDFPGLQPAFPGLEWGHLPFVLSFRVLGRGLIKVVDQIFYATVGIWKEAAEGFWLLFH